MTENPDQRPQERPLVVVAVGGNALIADAEHITQADQAKAASESMDHVADMVAEGWRVLVTHGNGPQVGFLLRRAELAAVELPLLPLDVLGADTQGGIGYLFTRALDNHFGDRGMDTKAVSLITRTVVSTDDPAFTHPSKPIGSFMTEADARRRADEDGWAVVEDSGRGWRRVVASPIPQEVLEIDAIRALLEAGFTVVAGGGGGVPLARTGDGFKGLEAVIDKDTATALIASELDADLMIISTGVDGVAINFNTPEEEWLSEITVAQARELLDAGQFGAGSMAPKIGAAIDFIERGGSRVVITSPARMVEALRGEAGTAIVP
jgi:carbamate kinase